MSSTHLSPARTPVHASNGQASQDARYAAHHAKVDAIAADLLAAMARHGEPAVHTRRNPSSKAATSNEMRLAWNALAVWQASTGFTALPDADFVRRESSAFGDLSLHFQVEIGTDGWDVQSHVLHVLTGKLVWA